MAFDELIQLISPLDDGAYSSSTFNHVQSENVGAVVQGQIPYFL